jgi:hypothetical protein
MTIRTSKKKVTFRKPFVLGEFDEVLPAGQYDVETDEELLEGISFPVYRRILTVIHLHPKTGQPGLTQALTIDPNELDAALKRDQVLAEFPVGRDTGQETPKETTGSRREEADDQAIERAEDEGMIVHPGHKIALRREQAVASQALGRSELREDTERGLNRKLEGDSNAISKW